MKLHNETKDDTIPVALMRDGQVAIITAWTVNDYIGRIVQRFGQSLVTLGETSDCAWDKFFFHAGNDSDLRVRILRPGTLLEV